MCRDSNLPTPRRGGHEWAISRKELLRTVCPDCLPSSHARAWRDEIYRRRGGVLSQVDALILERLLRTLPFAKLVCDPHSTHARLAGCLGYIPMSVPVDPTDSARPDGWNDFCGFKTPRPAMAQRADFCPEEASVAVGSRRSRAAAFGVGSFNDSVAHTCSERVQSPDDVRKDPTFTSATAALNEGKPFSNNPLTPTSFLSGGPASSRIICANAILICLGRDDRRRAVAGS